MQIRTRENRDMLTASAKGPAIAYKQATTSAGISSTHLAILAT